MASTRPGEQAGTSFEAVLAYFNWWDCPRAGVALLNGEPHYFLSDFSDALDDYEPEFQLWPVPPEALQPEREWQARWVAWRSAFDRREHPAPLERDAEFAELSRRLKDYRTPPADRTLAVPKWKLDTNRSYARRVPQHEVHWRVIDR